jgi:hypothetical protein
MLHVAHVVGLFGQLAEQFGPDVRELARVQQLRVEGCDVDLGLAVVQSVEGLAHDAVGVVVEPVGGERVAPVGDLVRVANQPAEGVDGVDAGGPDSFLLGVAHQSSIAFAVSFA